MIAVHTATVARPIVDFPSNRTPSHAKCSDQIGRCERVIRLLFQGIGSIRNAGCTATNFNFQRAAWTGHLLGRGGLQRAARARLHQFQELADMPVILQSLSTTAAETFWRALSMARRTLPKAGDVEPELVVGQSAGFANKVELGPTGELSTHSRTKAKMSPDHESTVNRPRSAFRMREQSAAAIPVRPCALRTLKPSRYV